MKLKQWLYGATALAMLAACSDKDIAPGGDNPNDEVTKFSKGVSYLGVSLELPSELGTRAKDNEQDPSTDGKYDQSNDNFGDGLSVEYNVTNAAILLFKGKEEATAKFVGAYVMGSDETFDNPTDDNITTSFQRTIRVLNKPSLSSGESYWGLALVNYDEDHFDIDTNVENTTSYGDLTIRTVSDTGITTPTIVTVGEESIPIYDENSVSTPTPITPVRLQTNASNATTFAKMREYTTDCKFVHELNGNVNNIFMTNAPLSHVPGTQTAVDNLKISTLTLLTSDETKFKETKAAAMADPAACIFVERAVAKITCSSFPEKVTFVRSEIDPDDSNGDGGARTQDVELKIASVKWMVDNEEALSYIIRNAMYDKDATPQLFDFWDYHSTNTANNLQRYRFIGQTGMNDWTDEDGRYDDNSVHDRGVNTLYRTYWCLDKGYADNKIFNKQAVKNSSSFIDYKSALYPHENTFDVEHQNYRNTTRVIFQVQYKNEKEANYQLYAIRGQLKTFYLVNDAKNLILRSAIGSNEMKELIRANLVEGKTLKTVTFGINDFNSGFGDAPNDIPAYDIKKDEYILTTFTFTNDFTKENFGLDQTSNDAAVKAKLASINEKLKDIANEANRDNHIVKFKDNTCYYAVYIQHFGNSYCQLPSGWKGDTVNEVYTDDVTTGETYNSVKYLGRYGLVRNNWYDIAIQTISKLGNADIPNGLVETSDDNKVDESFLSARVHVLSWAKRTQKVDL